MALFHSTPQEFVEIFSFIQAGLENRTLSPIVSPFSFTLNTAADAHVHIIDRPAGTIGKVILKCWE